MAIEAPRNHEVIINYPARIVIVNGKEIPLLQTEGGWNMAMKILHSDQPVSPRKLGLPNGEAVSHSIYNTRLILEDAEHELIAGDALKGFYTNANIVAVVGYPARPWLPLDTEKARAGIVDEIFVKETAAGVRIGEEEIPATGRQRELLLAVPATGEDVYPREALTRLLYGDSTKLESLQDLVKGLNLRKLRIAQDPVEIVLIRGVGLHGEKVSGYALRKYEPEEDQPITPKKKSRRVVPELEMTEPDEAAVKIFQNLGSKWIFGVEGMQWSHITEGLASSEQRMELLLEGKGVDEVYTPDEIKARFGLVFDKLRSDIANHDSWSIELRESWDRMQEFKRRWGKRLNKERTDDHLRNRVCQMVDNSLKDIQRNQEARHNRIIFPGFGILKQAHLSEEVNSDI